PIDEAAVHGLAVGVEVHRRAAVEEADARIGAQGRVLPRPLGEGPPVLVDARRGPVLLKHRQKLPALLDRTRLQRALGWEARQGAAEGLEHGPGLLVPGIGVELVARFLKAHVTLRRRWWRSSRFGGLGSGALRRLALRVLLQERRQGAKAAA